LHVDSTRRTNAKLALSRAAAARRVLFRFPTGASNEISGMNGGTALGDVKTMIRGEACLEKKQQNVPFGPVNARAKRVGHECQKHAKEIDAKYNNTMDGIAGPVQRAVQCFGRTRGFVVGACGECSQDLLKLWATLLQLRV
jgi:hypothetical protein